MSAQGRERYVEAGGRIRSARRAAGLSTRQLAAAVSDALGRPYTEGAVRNQENGTNGVRLPILQAYSKILDVPLVDLAGNLAGGRSQAENAENAAAPDALVTGSVTLNIRATVSPALAARILALLKA